MGLIIFQPTLPPCEERLFYDALFKHFLHFNSHSSCGEQRILGIQPHADISTHTPHAGSNAAPGDILLLDAISTHTPHTGSNIMRYFNAFQLTLPMRGATNVTRNPSNISTHTPHTGSASESRVPGMDF